MGWDVGWDLLSSCDHILEDASVISATSALLPLDSCLPFFGLSVIGDNGEGGPPVIVLDWKDREDSRTSFSDDSCMMSP